jgi:hypothetical protein
MPVCPRPTGSRLSANPPSRLSTFPKIGAAPPEDVRLDNGAIYLLDDFTVVEASTGRKLGVLRREYNHRIDRAHAQYHRELW